MNQNNHIVLVGLPGVGKTSIGKKLSKMLEMPHLDIDAEIESEQKIKINDFVKLNSIAKFRLLEKDRLYRLLEGQKPILISSGGGIILDEKNRNLIKQKSFGIYIKCDIDEIANRINTKNRPLLYNTNKKEELFDLGMKEKKCIMKYQKFKLI